MLVVDHHRMEYQLKPTIARDGYTYEKSMLVSRFCADKVCFKALKGVGLT